MTQFSYVNMNCGFSSIWTITSAAGIANLANVREMQYTFGSCTRLTSLAGGNGTANSSSQPRYQYFRIDRSGQAGYLTSA